MSSRDLIYGPRDMQTGDMPIGDMPIGDMPIGDTQPGANFSALLLS